MKYTVIRVLRNIDGQCVDCKVESNFGNKTEAESFLHVVNKYLSSTTLSWVLDSYAA